MQRIQKNTMGMFDCVKGIIILAVIVYHSFVEAWGINNSSWYPLIWRLLYASAGTMMGILFVISGYGFRPVKTWKAFKIQIKLLLKPYFIAFGFSILARIPLNLILGKDPFDGAMSRIAGCLLGQMGARKIGGIETESIFVFWFFLALLFGWLILSFIFHVFSGEKSRGAAVCICVAAGYLLGRFVPPLPYCIAPSLLAVGFLYFGYLLKKKGLLFCRINPVVFIICMAAGLAVMKFGSVNLSTGQMRLGLLDYFGTVCASFVLLRIYFWIFTPEWKIYSPFMFLGRNSSMIIAIHGFEHLVFQWRSWDWLITDSLLKKAIDFSCIRIVLILGVYAVVVKVKGLLADWEEEKTELPTKRILSFLTGILIILICTASFLSSGPGTEEETDAVWSSGLTFSVLGDSVSSYSGYTSEGNAAYYSEEDFDVSSMWWEVVASECGMTPCVINAGAGTGVTELLGLDYPTAGNSERCEMLSTEDTDPDVIFILLGGNDVLHQVPENEFKNSYLEMLDRIQSKYPEAAVCLCTYYQIPDGYEGQGWFVNEWIREIADETGLPLLDGELCDIAAEDGSLYYQDYDSSSDTALHANARGQEIFGNYIAETFLQSEDIVQEGKE